nr:hypothetical protein [Armatimonadota bacterium]
KASSYVLSLGAGGWLCTCHAFSNSLFTHCKHVAAIYEREYPESSETDTHLVSSGVHSSLMQQPRPATCAPVAAEDW